LTIREKVDFTPVPGAIQVAVQRPGRGCQDGGRRCPSGGWSRRLHRWSKPPPPRGRC